MRRLWRFAAVPLLVLTIWLGYQYWLVPAYLQPQSKVLQAYGEWIGQHGRIVIASAPDNAPFLLSSQGGQYTGFDWDLIRALERALGADFRLVPMSLQDACNALSQGEIDGIMGQQASPELAAFFAFTQPYLSNAQAIFVLRDQLDIHGPSDLAKRTVAVVNDSPAAYLVGSNATVNLVPVVSLEEAANRLLSGEVEAFVGDELASRDLLQRKNMLGQVKAVEEPLRRQGYTIAVRMSNQELLSLLNYGLVALETSGATDKIANRWFGTASAGPESAPREWPAAALAALLAAAAVVGSLYWWGQSMRRKMEEHICKLREYEQRQKALVENATDAIFSVHPSDTGILEVNRKAEQLTGYRRESLLHMRISDLFPDDMRGRSIRRLEEVLLSGAGAFDDMVLSRRDGSRIEVGVSASVIELERRKVIQILARDIAERKEMERELVRRNGNLSALSAISAILGRPQELDTILDAVLDKILDVVGAEMGAIYLSNEAAGNFVLRVYRGEPPVLAVRSQSVGEESRTFIIATNSGAAQLASAWWPGVPQPKPGSFVSAQLRTKDRLLGVLNVASRKQRWFTQGDVDLLTAVANQISIAVENAMLFSELRTAMDDLFAIKQFNENALQSIADGLITVDRSGRITSANAATMRIIGYVREQVLGQPVQQVLAPFSAVEHIVSETMQKGVSCTKREGVITHCDGSEIPIGLSTSPLRDNQGTVTGLLLVLHDLSDVTRMEAEKRKMDRLVALGEMSAVLAHELRNPLGSISVGIEFLAHKITDESQQRSIQLIMEESERVNRLIENVLIISRPPTLDLVPAHVSQIVDSTVTRWQGTSAERRVRITKSYAPDLGQCLVDRLRLDQALSNLISNALDAMPDGGDLRISVRKVRLLPDPSAAPHMNSKDAEEGLLAQEWIRIEIGDTGVGISADRLSQIFEPFRTTKAKGTGLGLAIAQRIIKDHKGNIALRSREGVGTVFTIDLPLAE